jgi:hypothetical protein
LLTIRWFLIFTFIAVVISDLAECHPFSHYWQVLPDPGGQCRQGYAQLLTMATCNVITDLMLVIFPISIIIPSHMPIKRKVQLVLLFSLSLSVVAVTLYRVPHIIWEHGRQQYRSLLASVELLFATASANALVLGSFVRDRGVKKQKFRRTSAADSFDRSSNARRPTLQRHWGSDEDLVRDVGLSVMPELRQAGDVKAKPTPAPVASGPNDDTRWLGRRQSQYRSEQSDDSLLSHELYGGDESPVAPKKLSFFDVGGLLDDSPGPSSSVPRRPSGTTSIMDAQLPQSSISHAVPASSGGMRRGSTALLQDLGGLFSPLSSRPSRARQREGTELQTIPQSVHEQTFNSHGQPNPVLQDPGGLLS